MTRHTRIFTRALAAALSLLLCLGLIPAHANILGRDDRVGVKNTSAYPYSAICYMDGRFKCGCSITGTGFMVSRNTMMTAAHCMICQKHNKHLKNMTFYFGYRNGKYLTKYTGRYHYWWGTEFPDGYTNSVRAHDHAYVRFEKDIGDTTGWFGLSSKSDGDLENNWYTISAYKNGKMTNDNGYCTVVDRNIAEISMDTVCGNSGSPIYDDSYHVSAMNIAYSNNGEHNYALRITSDIINELRNNGLV